MGEYQPVTITSPTPKARSIARAQRHYPRILDVDHPIADGRDAMHHVTIHLDLPALGAIARVERVDDSAIERRKNAGDDIGDPIDDGWRLHRATGLKVPHHIASAGLDRQQR
jgi:hypothetical protein